MEHIREVQSGSGAGRDDSGQSSSGLPTPNSHIARRLAFCDDVEQLMLQTFVSRREAFSICNTHFPTFESFNAYKVFRSRHPVPDHDPISAEIIQTFSQFGTSDTRGLGRRTRRELRDLLREEHKVCVQHLRAALNADPTFINRLLDDYARMLLNRIKKKRDAT